MKIHNFHYNQYKENEIEMAKCLHVSLSLQLSILFILNCITIIKKLSTS